MRQIGFILKPLPPFRLDFTVWALRRRPDNHWDRWDGRVYRRVLMVGEEPVVLTVTQRGPADAPELRVAAHGSRLKPEIEPRLISVLQRLLGLETDLAGFYRLAAKDPKLKTLAATFRGMKPTRYPTVFETLVNAITCQQFTLTAGLRTLGRLVTRYGIACQKENEVYHAFPLPHALARIRGEDLRKLGYSRQKAGALIELARMVVEGGVDLERLENLSDAEALERLTALRGVGRWTAEYALLRGLGRIHLFPGDDAGVRNRLRDWMKVGQPLDYEGVGRLLNRWKPYGGLIYFHLLLKGLSEEGYFPRGEISLSPF